MSFTDAKQTWAGEPSSVRKKNLLKRQTLTSRYVVRKWLKRMRRKGYPDGKSKASNFKRGGLRPYLLLSALGAGQLRRSERFRKRLRSGAWRGACAPARS